MLEEKEMSLKKTVETVHRLEVTVKESRKQCIAMESEMRSVRQEGASEIETKTVEISVLEKKLQAQAVTHAKLEKEMQEAKHKARQDHRLLAEAVKALRQERNAQLEKIKEQETKLREIQNLMKHLEDAEEQRKEQTQRIEALEEEQKASETAWEQKVLKAQEESQLVLVHLKERHFEETSALKDIIAEMEKTLADERNAYAAVRDEKETLERQRGRDDVTGDDIRLVIDVTAPEADGPQEAEVEKMKEELQRLHSENTELKETVKNVVAENTSLKGSAGETANDVSESEKEVANLDGLMLTIQQLQEEKRALLEANQTPDFDVTSMKAFSDWAENICRELNDCSSSAAEMDGTYSAEEANQIIEKVANSNGRLQLLTAQVEDMKASFPRDQPSVDPLFSSMTHILSDFIQKYKEINEMKIDAFLSRSAEPFPVASDELAKPQGSTQKRTPQRNTDSNASEEGMASGTPSVKMFLGGIGAKMSQSSQGLMSFMQRGAAANLPSEAEPVSLARRSPQP